MPPRRSATAAAADRPAPGVAAPEHDRRTVPTGVVLVMPARVAIASAVPVLLVPGRHERANGGASDPATRNGRTAVVDGADQAVRDLIGRGGAGPLCTYDRGAAADGVVVPGPVTTALPRRSTRRLLLAWRDRARRVVVQPSTVVIGQAAAPGCCLAQPRQLSSLPRRSVACGRQPSSRQRGIPVRHRSRNGTGR